MAGQTLSFDVLIRQIGSFLKTADEASKASGSVRQLGRDLTEVGKMRATPKLALDGDTAVKAKLNAVRVGLDELGKKVAEARVKVGGDKAALANLETLAVKLDTLGRKTADPRLTVAGVARAYADILGVSAALDKLDKKTAGPGIGKILSGLKGPGLAAPLAVLSPALIPVAAGLVAATGAITTSIAGAAVPLAAFGLLAKQNYTVASTAAAAVQKAQDNYNVAIANGTKQAVAYKAEQIAIGKAYSELSPAQIALSRQVGNFSNAWQGVQQATTPLVSGALLPWLHAATSAMAYIQPLVTPIAKVFKDWGQTLSNYFSSAKGSAEIGRMAAELGKFGAGQMKAIGAFFIDVAKGIANLGRDLAASGVDFGLFGTRLAEWGAAFLKWSGSAAARADVTRFLEYVHQNGPVVGDLLKNLGKFLAAFAPGLASAGTIELKLISDFMAFLAKMPKAVAAPLIDTAAALLLLSKMGVLKVGIQLVGAAAKWLTGGSITLGGASAAAEMRAAFATGGAAAAAEIRAAMAGGGAVAGGESAAGAGAAGARGIAPALLGIPAAAGAAAGLGTNALISTLLPRGTQTSAQAAWTKVGAGAAGGAAAGAGIGLIGGPLAPISVPVGAAIGGVGGAIAGAASDPKAIGGSIVNGVKAAFDTLKRNIPQWGSDAFKGISQAFQAAGKNITNWWDDTTKGIAQVWARAWSDLVSPVIRVFENVKKFISSSFDAWWKTHGDEIKQVWRAVWDVVSTVALYSFHKIVESGKVLWSGLTQIFDAIAKAAGSVWKNLASIFGSGGLGGVFKVAWDQVAGVTKAALAVIVSVAKVAWDQVAGIAKAAWAVIVSVVKVAAAAIVTLVKISWDILVGVFSVALDLITGHWGRAWHDLLTTFSQVWNAIRDFAKRVFGDITSAGRTASSALQTAWSQSWNAIKGVTLGAARAVEGFVRAMVLDILNVFGRIVHGAAVAFGWVPGLGGKLQGAARAFDTFRNQVNSALGGINGRTVSVSVAMTSSTNPYPGGISGRAASGMYVSQGTGPTADDVLIRASRGELIVPARMVQSGAVDHLRGAIPGFASGGPVGVNVQPHMTSAHAIGVNLWASIVTLAQGFAKAASAFGGGGAGIKVPNAGSGVMRWDPLVKQALAMEGLGAYLASQVEYQMMTESGGNPNAINLTDSNAAAGDPSRGLLQTIMSTFLAYHWPGTSFNIYDPLANIAAAINYARHTYGPTLMSGGMGMGSGHGYEAGSWNVPRTERALVHKGEMIIPALTAASLRSGGGGVTLEVRGGSRTAFDEFLLRWIRENVRVKGGRGPGSVQRAFGQT